MAATAERSSTGRIVLVIGLLLVLGLPFCHLGDLGKAYSHLGPLWGTEVLWWAFFVLILVYVRSVEGRPLASLQFRNPGWRNLLLAVVFAVVTVLGMGVLFTVVLPALHLTIAQKIAGLFQTPFWYRVLLVTRAAVVEETAFRGYGFERITTLTGSTWLAALVTLVLFTLAHYSGGGWGQVVIAGWGGLTLTALYMWRRNLWANIACHWLTDAAGFLLMPALPSHH